MIHTSDNKALVTGGWGGGRWGQVSCCDTDTTCAVRGYRETDVCARTHAPTHPKSGLKIGVGELISLLHITHNRLVGRGKWVHAWVQRAHRQRTQE